jgi:hypothetical protein
VVSCEALLYCLFRGAQMQRYAESIEDCGAALELDNSCLAAMVQRGKSYMELQEWEKAVSHTANFYFIFSSVVDPHHLDADTIFFWAVRVRNTAVSLIFIFSSGVDPHYVDADPDLCLMRIRIFI